MAGKPKSLKDQFAAAKGRVEKLEERPSNEELLQLYGLYKQATEGDVSGSRPGMLDLKGRAKYDAWARQKGASKDDAMKGYVALVAEARDGPGMRASASSRPLLPFLLLLAALPASAQAPYKLPPKEVVDLVDAPPPPQAVVSPTGDAVLLAEPEAYPPIALLAEPVLRLGGVRISPATGCRQRTFRFTGLQVQPVSGGPAVRVALPAGARVGLPVFSHDGRRFAFARDLADGVELWAGETTTGAARPVPGVRLNDVLGPAIAWTGRREAPRPRGPARPRESAAGADRAGGTGRRGDGGQGLADGDLPGPAPHAARRGALRALRAGAARRRRRRRRDGRRRSASRGSTPTSSPRPTGGTSSSQRREGAVLDAGALLLLRAHDRGVGRGGAARWRRSPTCRCRTRSRARACPTGPRDVAWQPLAAGDARLGRGARRRRPDEEGAAPRARDDARRPVRGGAPEVTRLKQRFAGLDWTGRPGVALVTRVRPRPALAHDLARGPRRARVREGPLRPLGERRLRRPRRAGDGDAADRRARRRSRTATRSTSRATARRRRATGRSSTASRSPP